MNHYIHLWGIMELIKILIDNIELLESELAQIIQSGEINTWNGAQKEHELKQRLLLLRTAVIDELKQEVA